MLEQEYRNLLFDAADGVEIFDVDLDRAMTKKEVNDKIKEICFKKTGLNADSTDKQIKRVIGIS